MAVRVSGKRTAAALTACITLAAIFAVFALYRDFSGQEARIEAYCRKAKPGTPIETAQAEATQAGLAAELHGATQWNPAYLSVTGASRFLPGFSFCSLDIDEGEISSVSYNPWYH